MTAAGNAETPLGAPLPAATRLTGATLVAAEDLAVLGLPAEGVAHLFALSAKGPPRLLRSLRAPQGDPFAEGPGFAAALALEADVLLLGATRVGHDRPQGPALEHPAGVFSEGAVFRLDLSADPLSAPRRIASGDAARTLGHALALSRGRALIGVLEAPAADQAPLPLAYAARGAVEIHEIGAPQPLRLDGPAGEVGFGLALARDETRDEARDEARDGTVFALGRAPDGSARLHEIAADGARRARPLPGPAESAGAIHIAAADGRVALSAPGGFSSEAGWTLLLDPGGAVHRIGAGGALALSAARLAILQPAAPEGPPRAELHLFGLAPGAAPTPLDRIPEALAAALLGETLIHLRQAEAGEARLCVTRTD